LPRWPRPHGFRAHHRCVVSYDAILDGSREIRMKHAGREGGRCVDAPPHEVQPLTHFHAFRLLHYFEVDYVHTCIVCTRLFG
jgi:hypothetical protein